MKKKWFIKDKVDDDRFIEVCKNSISMSQACAELKLHFNSFKRRAVKLGCYKTNQAGKGIKRNKIEGVIPLQEILDGKHPQYQTFKLKNRLLKEGLKKNECEVCRLKEWRDVPLNMELDHIDGDRTNHKFKNLRMICPNCHAQTETYRSLNRH